MCPHGNCTHTEGVGHITHNRIPMSSLLKDISILMPALLITITPILFGTSGDSSGPQSVPDDLVICSRNLSVAIQSCLSSLPIQQSDAFSTGFDQKALIIRTQNTSKSEWSGTNPAYLSLEAVKLIRQLNVVHLLVDLPSVDREQDGGHLIAHRNFWEISKDDNDGKIGNKTGTITELCEIDSDVKDGLYVLNLQIAGMCSDAAPSRPIVYPVLSEM